MNRETAVRCMKGRNIDSVTRKSSGPERLCAFTIARESYGESVAYRARCIVHADGEIVIGLAHRDSMGQRSGVDPDYRADLSVVRKR